MPIKDAHPPPSSKNSRDPWDSLVRKLTFSASSFRGRLALLSSFTGAGLKGQRAEGSGGQRAHNLKHRQGTCSEVDTLVFPDVGPERAAPMLALLPLSTAG